MASGLSKRRVVQGFMLIVIVCYGFYFFANRFPHARPTDSPSFVVPVLAQPESCSALFASGKFIASEFRLSWTPSSCSLVLYLNHTSDSVRMCAATLRETRPHGLLRNKTVIMTIGDSRLRQLAHETIRLLTGSEELVNLVEGKPEIVRCDPPTRNGSNEWIRTQCHLKHYISSLDIEVQRYFVRNVDSTEAVALLKALQFVPPNEFPEVIVINAGAWLILHCMDEYISTPNCSILYVQMLNDLKVWLKPVSQRTKVIWVPQNPIDARFRKRLVLTWVENPVLRYFNHLAATILADTKVYFWWSYNDIYEQFADTHDGIHLGLQTKFLDAQILLNALCNGVMSRTPNVCCSQPV